MPGLPGRSGAWNKGRQGAVAEMIRCPFCGKETGSGLRNCAHCGGPLQTVGSLIPPKPGFRAQTCPNCARPVQPGDIICLACGTNLLTGQKIVMENKAPQKAGGGGMLRWLGMVAGGLFLVVLLGGGGFLAARMLRNPVDSARQLAAQGNIPEALNKLQAYVQNKSGDRDARVLQGKLFWQGQQYAKAADALEAAYKLDTKNAETGFLAVVAAGRLSGDDGLKKQAVILREILAGTPGNEHAVRLLAMTLGALGDFSAQDTLSQDLRDNPALADGSLQTTFGVGRALQRGLPEAEEMLRKARAVAPESGDAAAALGFVLNLEGQSEAAEEALAKAVELNTSVAGMAKMQLGMLYLQSGKYEKALTLFNGAKAELKDDPRQPFYAALALELTGLGTEALVEYERISTGNGPFAGPAALQMAGLYVKKNQPDKALLSVRRATELGVSSARLFTVQGQVQAQQANPNEAEQSYRRAIQADANYPGAHLELGLMLVGKNAVADGVRELDRYLELTADKAAGTPRRNEVELLVNQLKQTEKTS